MKKTAASFPGVSRLVYADEMESTQNTAKMLAEEGAEDQTLVWAKKQKAGRGRMERTWESPEGGLYFSLILRPHFSPRVLAKLSLKTAKAVSAALFKIAGIETRIKPPNDIYARQGETWKKISGILIEAAGNETRLFWLVIGIGININNRPQLESATSLKILTRKDCELKEVLSLVLKEMSKSDLGLGKK